MSETRLRLAVLQSRPRLRDARANLDAIAAAAEEDGLLVTPELALTGYDLGDDAAALALALPPGAAPPALAALAAGADVVLGLPEATPDGLVYNAAAYLAGGRVVHVHRKVYPPTYGMFDEMRFFARGQGVRVFTARGWRIALLVCEDFWHPALAYLAAAGGADLLVVLAAAPGRGAWEGGTGGARFASAAAWEGIATTTARLYGVYVALANRVGAEGAVTFAGGSLLVAPDGAVVARAPDDAESRIGAEISLGEVRRARRPFSHARDEDLRLVRAELDRLLREREE